MNAPLFAASVPVYTQMLKAFSKILDKAEAYAETKKIDPSVLLNARIYPDMFPFVRQVQTASDFAKGPAARLANIEPPAFEDNEKTFADLQARITKTLGFLKTLKLEQFAGAEGREITIKPGGQEMKFKGDAYLHHFALPNFYFHLTTAYAILRHNGLDIGKWDFMGRN
jgi:hypothetical protein